MQGEGLTRARTAVAVQAIVSLNFSSTTLEPALLILANPSQQLFILGMSRSSRAEGGSSSSPRAYFAIFVSLASPFAYCLQMVLQKATVGQLPIYHGGPSHRPTVIVLQVMLIDGA